MKWIVKCFLVVTISLVVHNSLFGQITGSGSTNYISKFTGSTTIGNSVLYDDGSNITIGNAIGNDNPHAIYFGSEGDYYNYGIFRTPGSWSGNYQQLKIRFQTGIILDPGSGFGLSYVNIPEGGLRVTGGNVGIGTSSPSHRLDVVGNANQLGVISSSTGGEASTVYDPNGSINAWQVGVNSATPGFFVFENGPNAYRLVIKQGGNVLIGQISQAGNYRLDVKGGIRADSVVVNTNGADFVFDENYQKISLDSLGEYIMEHKHLPDIAPADSMMKDGVSVGAMQMKLLQKVEELTLYVIEQNKRIEKLEKENEELRNMP